MRKFLIYYSGVKEKFLSKFVAEKSQLEVNGALKSSIKSFVLKLLLFICGVEDKFFSALLLI